jgi:hypothetical protein
MGHPRFPTHVVGTPSKGNRDAEDAPDNSGGKPNATRAVEKIKIDQVLLRKGGLRHGPSCVRVN